MVALTIKAIKVVSLADEEPKSISVIGLWKQLQMLLISEYRPGYKAPSGYNTAVFQKDMIILPYLISTAALDAELCMHDLVFSFKIKKLSAKNGVCGFNSSCMSHTLTA